MDENKNKAVAYVRVSTEEQVENFSLENQLIYCQRKAKELDTEIIKVYRDEGFSAKTTNRPSLMECLNYTQKNKAKIRYLIIYKIDRLSRNTKDYLGLKFALAKYKITVISCIEPTDDTPAGEFLETVIAASGQWDNSNRALNSRNGMRRALEAGETPYKPPIGYNLKDNIGVPKDPDWSIIKMSFQQMLKGSYSKADFVQMLNKAGLRNRNGKPISQQQGHKILRNPYYAGINRVEKWGEEFKGLQKQMLTEYERANLQDILDGKRVSVKPHLRNNPEFPLKGDLYCSKCSKKLSGGISTGKNKQNKYPYYLCPQCRKPSIPRDGLHSKFVWYLREIKPKSLSVKLFKEVVKDVWQIKNMSKVDERKRISDEVESLEEKRQRILDNQLKGVYDEGLFKEQLNKVDKEISKRKSDLNNVNLDKGNISRTLDYMGELFEHYDEAWIRGEINVRQRVQRAIFPRGLTYENPSFRTPELALPFSIIGESGGQKTTMVNQS